MSEDVDTKIDAATAARIAGVLAKVQTEVPDADENYIYTGAVRVGLNRLGSSKRTYTGAQFAPHAGTGVTDVTVAVEDDDVARADAIADARNAERSDVVGAALCTGLAMLSGVDAAIVGPFSVS